MSFGLFGVGKRELKFAEKSSDPSVRALLKAYKVDGKITKEYFIKKLRKHVALKKNFDAVKGIRNQNLEEGAKDEAEDILSKNDVKAFKTGEMLAQKITDEPTTPTHLSRSLGSEFGDLYFHNPFRFPMEYISNVPKGYSLSQWEFHLHVTRMEYIMDEVVKFVNKDCKKNKNDWLHIQTKTDSGYADSKTLLAFFIGPLFERHRIHENRVDEHIGPNIINRLLGKPEITSHAKHTTAEENASFLDRELSRSTVLLANLSRYDAALFIIRSLFTADIDNLVKLIKREKNIAKREPTQFTLLNATHKSIIENVEKQYGILPKYVRNSKMEKETAGDLESKRSLEVALLKKYNQVRSKQLAYFFARFKQKIKDVPFNQEHSMDIKNDAAKQLLAEMVSIGVSPKKDATPVTPEKYNFTFMMLKSEVDLLQMKENSSSYEKLTGSKSTRRRHSRSSKSKSRSRSSSLLGSRRSASSTRSSSGLRYFGGRGSKLVTFTNKHGLESFFDHMISDSVSKSSFEKAANELIVKSYRDPQRLPKGTNLKIINPLLLYPKMSWVKTNYKQMDYFEKYWADKSNAKELFTKRLSLADDFYDLTMYYPLKYSPKVINEPHLETYTKQQWLFHLRTARYGLLLQQLNKFVKDDVVKHAEDYGKFFKIFQSQPHKVHEFLIDGYSGGKDITKKELEKLKLHNGASDSLDSFRQEEEKQETNPNGTLTLGADGKYRNANGNIINIAKTSGGGLLSSYLEDTEGTSDSLNHVDSSMKNDIIGRLRRHNNLNIRLLFSRISDVDIASLLLNCLEPSRGGFTYTAKSMYDGLDEPYMSDIESNMFAKMTAAESKDNKSKIVTAFADNDKAFSTLKKRYLHRVTDWYNKKKQSYETERERLSNQVYLSSAQSNSVGAMKELQNLDKKMFYFFIACLQDHIKGMHLGTDETNLGDPGKAKPTVDKQIHSGQTSRNRSFYDYGLPVTWLPGDAFDTIYAF